MQTKTGQGLKPGEFTAIFGPFFERETPRVAPDLVRPRTDGPQVPVADSYSFRKHLETNFPAILGGTSAGRQPADLSATGFGRRVETQSYPANTEKVAVVNDYDRIVRTAAPLDAVQVTPVASATPPAAAENPQGITAETLALVLAGMVIWLHLEALLILMLLRH